LLEGAKVKLSPQVCENDRFGLFVATMVKLQQFVINEPDVFCLSFFIMFVLFVCDAIEFFR